MLASFQRDSAGLAEILQSMFDDEVHELATGIAETVRSAHPGVEVIVEDETTDRSRSTVVVRDPRAAGWEARDGLLTRAAGTAGLQVRGR